MYIHEFFVKEYSLYLFIYRTYFIAKVHCIGSNDCLNYGVRVSDFFNLKILK